MSSLARWNIGCWLICCVCSGPAWAERRSLHSELTHLRSGDSREWDYFDEQATGSELRVEFIAQSNASPCTLGLRRIDVKEAWTVSLNGQVVAKLFSDENDIEEAWELPAGRLLDGSNVLEISAGGERLDDVLIGDVWLDERPRREVHGELQLKLVAMDAAGEALPCRFTIVNEHGALAALWTEPVNEIASRSGVVYSATGAVTVGLARGSYTVFCGRGFEYDLQRCEIDAEQGVQQTCRFVLHRVVDTRGLVAADTHVHTFEVSRHGDASLAERMVTLAGEGIELAFATDHNVFVDYRGWLRQLQLESYLTPVLGNEVTTSHGHFNIAPATPEAIPPNHRTNDWEQLFADIWQTPSIRLAILNHPRDVHSGFRPFGPENMIAAVGQRLDGRRLQANAVELINSAALQTDPMLVFHDWQTQLNRGLALTAVGSSDSHEVSRKIVGQGRSYVAVDDSSPGAIDVDTAIDNMLAGRVCVSLGLLTELTVDERARAGDTQVVDAEAVNVTVRVQGPEWTEAEVVELYVNGELTLSERLPPESRHRAGDKANVQWTLPKPTQDVQLVAVARGPGVTGLHWPIAKPYQPSSTHWDSYVFGSSGVVRLDADGQPGWTSPRAAAEQLVAQAEGDLTRLISLLKPWDVPTAAFAAELWTDAGRSIRNQAARAAISSAAAHVQAGFERFADSQRRSLEASRASRPGS